MNGFFYNIIKLLPYSSNDMVIELLWKRFPTQNRNSSHFFYHSCCHRCHGWRGRCQLGTPRHQPRRHPPGQPRRLPHRINIRNGAMSSPVQADLEASSCLCSKAFAEISSSLTLPWLCFALLALLPPSLLLGASRACRLELFHNLGSYGVSSLQHGTSVRGICALHFRHKHHYQVEERRHGVPSSCSPCHPSRQLRLRFSGNGSFIIPLRFCLWRWGGFSGIL